MKYLFVDDIREAPEGWDVARTYDEAIEMLSKTDYDVLSLDHDLADVHYACGETEGFCEKTGYDIALWLAERKNDGGYTPIIIHCHSANPVGRDRILGVVARYL